jgi:hypothetical protein
MMMDQSRRVQEAWEDMCKEVREVMPVAHRAGTWVQGGVCDESRSGTSGRMGVRLTKRHRSVGHCKETARNGGEGGRPSCRTALIGRDALLKADREARNT